MSAKKEGYLAELKEMSDAEHLADSAPVEATTPQADASDNTDNQQANGERQRKQLVLKEIVSWFAACARCSFFLAGYQLEYNRDQSIQETDSSESGWLNLGWNQSICKLLRKSYGFHLYMDCYHYEGVCPECQRQFVYHVSEEGSKGRFQIELKPKMGR